MLGKIKGIAEHMRLWAFYRSPEIWINPANDSTKLIETDSGEEEGFVCVTQQTSPDREDADCSTDEAEYVILPEKHDLHDKIFMYFIHGTADYAGAFKNFQHVLEHAGLPESIIIARRVDFEKRFCGASIGQFAEQLKTRITQEDHATRVILVGHSRGGLIATVAADLLQKENVSVEAVFPICAPVLGSPWAIKPLTLISDSVDEMRKSNIDFQNKLREMILASKAQYYYFAASDDLIVNPEDCCIAEHKDRLKTFMGHGHLSILTSAAAELAIDIRKKIINLIAEKKISIQTEAEEEKNDFPAPSARI